MQSMVNCRYIQRTKERTIFFIEEGALGEAVKQSSLNETSNLQCSGFSLAEL